MIIKSSQRAAAMQLADHLTKKVDTDGTPQTVAVTGSRNLLVGSDVHEAMSDMETMAWASAKCQKHLYHISISPSQALTDAEWQRAWQVYEDEFKLNDRAYIEVNHGKGDRPDHRHRVYERVDVEGKAILLSHTRVRNEKVARLLEHELGHPLTLGKHNRAVMLRLKEEGRQAVVQWMEQGQAHALNRPAALKDHTDHQQEKRTGKTVEQVRAELQAAWDRADSGKAFEAAIAEQGYVLAKGDKRDFVIVDEAGGVHSPRRRLGVKVKELRVRWGDLDPEHLPTVGQIHAERKPEPSIAYGLDGDEAIAALEIEDQRLAAEIAQLEKELAAPPSWPRVGLPDDDEAALIGLLQTMPDAAVMAFLQERDDDDLSLLDRLLNPRIMPGTANDGGDSPRQEDQRQRIGAGNTRHIEPERRSPRSQPANQRQMARGNGRMNPWTVAGESAEQEIAKRIRRAEKAHQAGGQVPEPPVSSIRAYQHLLGERLSKGGAVAYQSSDRWLVLRLARRGYSKPAIREAVLWASPALLEQPVSARQAYIRQLVYRLEPQIRQTEQQRERQAETMAKALQQPSTALRDSAQSVAAAQRRQVALAQQALQKKDFANYQGQATREYRKELARKLNAHGQKMVDAEHGIATDQDITARLYLAGYSKRQIMKTLMEASPQMAALTPEQQSNYWQRYMNPNLNHYKMRSARADMWDIKYRHNLMHERRLDRLNLATTGQREQDRDNSQDWNKEW